MPKSWRSSLTQQIPTRVTRRKPNWFELEFWVINGDIGENSRIKVQNVSVDSTAKLTASVARCQITLHAKRPADMKLGYGTKRYGDLLVRAAGLVWRWFRHGGWVARGPSIACSTASRAACVSSLGGVAGVSGLGFGSFLVTPPLYRRNVARTNSIVTK